jgi:hypothetical protein
MAAMAGRCGGMVEVTKMRAAETATTVVVNYPLFSMAMVRDNEREGK